LFDAVSQAMAQTPRSSSLVENLNSRLRNYFNPSYGFEVRLNPCHL
jgi:hypothetical protein